MDAIRALRGRYSIRSFTDEPVDRQIIEDLVDCARFAPTAHNLQPCEFIVVTDDAICRQLADLTDHGKFIAEAPVCIAIFSQETKYFIEDGSAATTQLLVAAHALGLGACWVAGDKKPYMDTVRQLLDVPQGYRLISLIALGHPDDPSPQKDKRPLDDLLHWEKW